MESDFVADQQSIVFVTIFKLLSYLADITTDTAAGITYFRVNYCDLSELWNYDEDSDEVKFPTRSTTAISCLRNVNETSKNHFRDKAPVYGFVTLGLLWLPGIVLFSYLLHLAKETEDTKWRILSMFLALLVLPFAPIAPFVAGVVLICKDNAYTRKVFQIAILGEAAFEASIQVVLQGHINNLHPKNIEEFSTNFTVIDPNNPNNSITLSHRTISYISICFSTFALATSSLACFKPLREYLNNFTSFLHGLVIIFSQAFRIVCFIVIYTYCSFAIVVVIPIWLNNIYYLNKSGIFKKNTLLLLINSILNVPLICLCGIELNEKRSSRAPTYDEADGQPSDNQTGNSNLELIALGNKLIKAANAWQMLTLLLMTIFILSGYWELITTTALVKSSIGFGKVITVLFSWGFISSLICSSQKTNRRSQVRLRKTKIVMGIASLSLFLAVQWVLFDYLKTTISKDDGLIQFFNCTTSSYVAPDGPTPVLVEWKLGDPLFNTTKITSSDSPLFDNLARTDFWITLAGSLPFLVFLGGSGLIILMLLLVSFDVQRLGSTNVRRNQKTEVLFWCVIFVLNLLLIGLVVWMGIVVFLLGLPNGDQVRPSTSNHVYWFGHSYGRTFDEESRETVRKELYCDNTFWTRVYWLTWGFILFEVIVITAMILKTLKTMVKCCKTKCPCCKGNSIEDTRKPEEVRTTPPPSYEMVEAQQNYTSQESQC